MAISFLVLLLTHLLTRRSATRGPRADVGVRPTFPQSATVVIPNWNGKDLLAKYIPSIRTALAGNSANQILVVDNGSTDGSADFLRATFPDVTVLALPMPASAPPGTRSSFC